MLPAFLIWVQEKIIHIDFRLSEIYLKMAFIDANVVRFVCGIRAPSENRHQKTGQKCDELFTVTIEKQLVILPFLTFFLLIHLLCNSIWVLLRWHCESFKAGEAYMYIHIFIHGYILKVMNGASSAQAV